MRCLLEDVNIISTRVYFLAPGRFSVHYRSVQPQGC